MKKLIIFLLIFLSCNISEKTFKERTVEEHVELIKLYFEYQFFKHGIISQQYLDRFNLKMPEFAPVIDTTANLTIGDTINMLMKRNIKAAEEE